MTTLEDIIKGNPLILSDEQYAEYEAVPKIAMIALVLDTTRANTSLYMKMLDTLMRETGLLIADLMSLDYMRVDEPSEDIEVNLKLYIYLHNRMAHDLAEGIAHE